MLSENLWQERGLVNGALGTVNNIVWEEGATPRDSPPVAICVVFDGYDGPALYEIPNGKPVVPILRSHRDFSKVTHQCTRVQFPLSIAFAITVHKSQGISIAKAVLDVSAPEFSPGLNYVAVSRLKTLEGLLFDCPFDLDVIRKKAKGKTAAAREADWVRRTRQTVPLVDEQYEAQQYEA